MSDLSRPAAPLPHTALDMDLKVYFRVHKTLPFLLLGLHPDPAHIRNEETTAVLRQLEADRFFLHDPPGGPAEGLLLEIFMDPPKEDQFRDCLQKAWNLSEAHKIPVGLLFLYLRKGRYATFPNALEVEVLGRVRNRYEVETLRLWEFEEEIRTGELAALAPLLLLWETNLSVKGVAAVQETVAIL
ncbi:MAG: hypothetical protein FJX77_02340, partial [Armatimonadetes bacterium]|nr:hypothetical protein [Armatimonadota bacterium]